MDTKVARLSNRAKRELITKFPPATRFVAKRHASRLQRHRPDLPLLDGYQADMLARLHERGVVVATLDELAIPGSRELQPVLLELADRLSRRSPEGGSSVRLPGDEMLEDLRLWRWGLQDRMLDLAENYLGVPVRYHGARVRREIADHQVVDVRHWHRDIEDHRVLKILVWLNDVDRSGGPFTYIERAETARLAKTLGYVAGFVGDDEFRRLVPEHDWGRATGPRWTAVMSDTAAIFHRAQPPEARDRYSVTFTWASCHPIKTMPDAPYTREQARRCVEGLTPRQLGSLPPALRRSAG